MVAPPSPSRLLVAAAGLILAAAATASASVIEVRQVQGPNRPWVTVDADGNASTLRASRTTVDGTVTTTNAQPYSLTGSVFTLTATDGSVTTSTGDPPPPRATDSSGGRGYFAVCRDGSISSLEGFCQPRNDAELYVDVPYYITWDTHQFPGDRDTRCRINGYAVSRNDRNRINESEPSWTLGGDDDDDNIRLGDGWHVWTPREADLNGAMDFSNYTIEISYVEASSGRNSTRTGATIAVLPARDDIPAHSGAGDDEEDDDEDSGSGGSGGPNVAAIVVPIVVVVLAVLGIGLWLLLRKRRRDAAAAAGGGAAGGAGAKRVSSGFGSRASGDGRPDPGTQKDDVGIQLQDRSPTSPTSGGNVFQEEMARQERERGEGRL